MLYRIFHIKQLLLVLSLILFIFQAVNADTLNHQREQAKAAYFQGELERSLSLFVKISETVDAESQYYMGLIYLTEGWSGKNNEKGASYIKASAEQNNTEAMWKLGELYEYGQGVSKDLMTALDWYRKSKQSEILKSNIEFFEVMNGQHILKSKSEIIEKIKTKALNKDAEAQFIMASIYDEGKLIEQNFEEAFYWYKAAAENRHDYSMMLTGYMLCRGVGVELNKEKANEWLEKLDRNAHCD